MYARPGREEVQTGPCRRQEQELELEQEQPEEEEEEGASPWST